jgi:hypothetical protein
MSKITLASDFLQAINDVSYYNAAEGNAYWNEAAARRKAEERLRELKKAMVEEYGKQETIRIANSQPHLAYSELLDLEG